ncbi:CDP-diacylglycerol--serine O-phosphatidyltransferase [Natronospirillum operosum]|uniref:CDP-diacylglycerol--serine O-phosphatidyltransferase n=1 Tax=Natronospirillum operosum TaxID=2759953 RepID=A0A4Z0WBG3_9GAMM|nr:CDP-diacylglycerol--serine O-phosphatidyltransferase [Natronospirillum operosum]TGG91976.1 CDP-diacylglycerol--serine O-phosphatidyltransferase [Natronospirillum operosum]
MAEPENQNNDPTPDNVAMTPEARKRRRTVYLVPNLLTTTALFAGFYAIIAAINGNFSNAAVGIFVAMVFDGLDGRVARLTHTQSEFGANYDSMSDLIAFGLAPALVAFLWSLESLDQVGWGAAFVYTAAAALRLARFNVQLGSVDKKYFIGLASPAAAAMVAGTIWAFNDMGFEGNDLAWLMVVLVPGLGCLMVSNIRYYSFKDFGLRGSIPFTAVLLVILAFVVVAVDPPIVLLLLFIAYAASGPVMEVWRRMKRRSQGEPEADKD